MKSKGKVSRRVAANRADAKKSTGPKTPEGKAKSSRNSLRHGLSSATFIVHADELDEYLELRSAYMARISPRNQTEIDLVDHMVQGTWGQRRAWALGNELLNIQMLRMEPEVAREFIDIPPSARLALAADELARTPGLPSFQRYDSHFSLEFQRALKTLLNLRRCEPVASTGLSLELPPEPPLRCPQPADPEQVSTSLTENTERSQSPLRTPPSEPRPLPLAAYT